jgi:hypothetical protein
MSMSVSPKTKAAKEQLLEKLARLEALYPPRHVPRDRDDAIAHWKVLYSAWAFYMIWANPCRSFAKHLAARIDNLREWRDWFALWGKQVVNEIWRSVLLVCRWTGLAPPSGEETTIVQRQ